MQLKNILSDLQSKKNTENDTMDFSKIKSSKKEQISNFFKNDLSNSKSPSMKNNDSETKKPILDFLIKSIPSLLSKNENGKNSANVSIDFPSDKPQSNFITKVPNINLKSNGTTVFSPNDVLLKASVTTDDIIEKITNISKIVLKDATESVTKKINTLVSEFSSDSISNIVNDGDLSQLKALSDKMKAFASKASQLIELNPPKLAFTSHIISNNLIPSVNDMTKSIGEALNDIKNTLNNDILNQELISDMPEQNLFKSSFKEFLSLHNPDLVSTKVFSPAAKALFGIDSNKLVKHFEKLNITFIKVDIEKNAVVDILDVDVVDSKKSPNVAAIKAETNKALFETMNDLKSSINNAHTPDSKTNSSRKNNPFSSYNKGSDISAFARNIKYSKINDNTPNPTPKINPILVKNANPTPNEVASDNLEIEKDANTDNTGKKDFSTIEIKSKSITQSRNMEHIFERLTNIIEHKTKLPLTRINIGFSPDTNTKAQLVISGKTGGKMIDVQINSNSNDFNEQIELRKSELIHKIDTNTSFTTNSLLVNPLKETDVINPHEQNKENNEKDKKDERNEKDKKDQRDERDDTDEELNDDD